MSFGLCRDCRHWAARAFLSYPTKVRYCALTESHDGLSITPTKALACDFEQYGARLITEPDFGCVQFASSQPETESRGL